MAKGDRTSDQDDFITDFGRNPPLTTRLFYFTLATLPLLLSTYLFIRLYVLQISSCILTLLSGIILGALILSIAYHQLFFATAARLRLTTKRPSKNSFKGKKSEYDVAVKDYEGGLERSAFCYSYFYNNLLFLMGVPFFGVYLVGEKVSGDLCFVVAAGLAGGVAWFNSKSALRAIGES